METVYCSFCRRPNDAVMMMISGHAAQICNLCIDNASTLVRQEASSCKFKKKQFRLIPPKEIKEYLDQYVIGQDSTKRVLSVAVYNHYKRSMQIEKTPDIVIEKSNVLLIGETGTGKTYLARILANNILDVPFCIVDATALTEAGYVGDDVESILTRLLQVADYDISAAEQGIIYIDEIDKLARKNDSPSITRDVGGEGVQQSLLKLLEGSIVNVPPQGGRKHPEQKMIQINTANILFICGGAFDGIENIAGKRLHSRGLGFSRDLEVSNNKNIYISQHDLRRYGLIPELIGRLPVISQLDNVDESMLKKILTKPKNSLLKQYKKLFEMEGVKLRFTERALQLIIQKALSLSLGARGLRTVCEAIVMDAMFELPSQKDIDELKIDREYVQRQLKKEDVRFRQVA